MTILKKNWGIVVGQPKLEAFVNSKPNMNNVGQWVQGYLGQGKKWGVALYSTRKRAREEAKKLDQGSDSWHYHAKKYKE